MKRIKNTLSLNSRGFKTLAQCPLPGKDHCDEQDHDSKALIFSMDTSYKTLQQAHPPCWTIAAAFIFVAQTKEMVPETIIHTVRHTQDGHLTILLFRNG
jgi:hypothetical protein